MMQTLSLALPFILCLSALGQPAKILSPEISADGHFTVGFVPDEFSYYVLRKGETVDQINTVVAVQLPPAIVIIDPAISSTQRTAFYRLQEVPVFASLDLDHDGIDDVYELQHSTYLHPLDAADALLDPDRNGLTHLEEYHRAVEPLTTIAEISPAN